MVARDSVTLVTDILSSDKNGLVLGVTGRRVVVQRNSSSGNFSSSLKKNFTTRTVNQVELVVIPVLQEVNVTVCVSGLTDRRLSTNQYQHQSLGHKRRG